MNRSFGTDVSRLFAVLSQTLPTVALRAAGVGGGLLRIVEPSSGLLLDRISITAAQVERVQIEAFSPLASGQAGTALLEGTRGLVAIKLEDRTGHRTLGPWRRPSPPRGPGSACTPRPTAWTWPPWTSTSAPKTQA